MTDPAEEKFETDIVESLVRDQKYIQRANLDYDKELCLDADMLFDFIRSTQSEEWQKLKDRHGDDRVKDKFLNRLTRVLQKQGTLDVLRKGVKDTGCHFDLIYFKPETALNEAHQKKYRNNRFSVIRQLHYSRKNPNKSIDLCLFINGIPIITAELKNTLNGQDVDNAIKQYRTNRDPAEPLLQFGRCFGHFAVDPHLVYMTTKLQDESTVFLPFNRGYQYGAGNPPMYDDYDTSYLWQEIWSKDLLLDIIQNFLQIVDKRDEQGNVSRQLIFPRYHQLGAVNLLVENTRINGVGRKYLIQHSAGSGKSNSIAWLCNKLAGLHDENNENIFDSIIVITDRRVLDEQLRNTIMAHEQVRGTVEAIDRNKSKRLAEAIEAGKKIIIVTLQTFPFAIELFHKTPGKRFAVVIDEAHSSQTGNTARDVRKVLVTEDTVEYEDEQVRDVEDTINEKMDEITTDLKLQPKNISFYAFTATPKNKTMEMFGEEQADGTFEPFHLYSMKQAIEEGFIMDVLQNYTTYTTYFELMKSIEDDPRYQKMAAKSLLKNYVGSSEYAIRQKTELMLNHFATNTINRIGGKAKAMLVTGSRANAVRYELEFKKQIAEKGYPFDVLVAFSGVVQGEDVYKKYTGKEFTESGENGFPDSQTAEKFNEDEYRIMIVANKFQTGFDQPLLHTMYVDKKLGGVDAVQTLSRLNRIHPDKSDTMVLDFVNEAEKIKESFEKYHVKTTLTEATDPNKLYDYENQLRDFGVFDDTDINNFAAEYFSSKGKQANLYTALHQPIRRWGKLEEDERRDFKKKMTVFVRQYAFLSQIISFFDDELEKFYQFSRFLIKELHIEYDRLPKEVTDKVKMSSFRLQETSNGQIYLSDDEGNLEPVPEPGAIMNPEDEMTPLSEIVKEINEASGAEMLTDEDKVAQVLGNMQSNMIANQRMRQASSSEVNEKKDVKLIYNEIFGEELNKLIDVNFELFSKIKNEEEFAEIIKEKLFNNVYRAITEEDTA
ncbi:type I restriction endonuclease subunit R [Methanohalophilus sp. WG1-DM]|uniref:type I restriction endonuclease subunit R n=1 Tax=Methanohalophilus sp. WG1-DM TaxID=2491675 RepID=UPI000FFEDFB4|nr:type I restriction endonuclease [Methanohalophilus sp. WG1-DM]RXG35183.1 hypothetical protein CI957_207 [Methanohalophilus sp. WG1-DM]